MIGILTRQDIIRDYIRGHGADVEMLEIGVDYGDTWHHQRGLVCNYTGVDVSLNKVTVPMTDPRSHWIELSSLDFWAKLAIEGVPDYVHGGWNLIYIDGCHDYDVVLIDIREGLKYLVLGGYMLVHDTDIEENGPYRAFREICVPDGRLMCYYKDSGGRENGMGVAYMRKEE